MAGFDSLNEVLAADFGEAVARRRDDTQLATARQRDGAAFDMRALGAAIAGEIVRADDPATYGSLNAGVRIPTTLDHPGVGAGK